MTAIELLIEDLFGLYAVAGREVTYTTDSGEVRPYWANRYRQAVQRAVTAGDAVGFVERLVQGEPSRGFGYLVEADRLDLTVEALVIDENKPYHGLFSPAAIETSQLRLADHRYQSAAHKRPAAPTPSDVIGDGGLRPGMSFDVRVVVEADGKLSLRLI